MYFRTKINLQISCSEERTPLLVLVILKMSNYREDGIRKG
jgi:hypothetical protein